MDAMALSRSVSSLDDADATGALPSLLEHIELTKRLRPRWRNWLVRVVLGAFMISAFSLIVYLGPLAMTALILFIQMKCFHEIMRIAFSTSTTTRSSSQRRRRELWVYWTGWYLLLVLDADIIAQIFMDRYSHLFWPEHAVLIRWLHRYEPAFIFGLYSLGMCPLVRMVWLKERRRTKKKSASDDDDEDRLEYLIAYTVLCVLLSKLANGLILSVYEGIIWFLLPVSLIIFNDIMAYMFGFFFGRTQLIELSPKKTWEGFVGSAVTTVLFGFLISALLCENDYFTRPVLEPRSSLSSSSSSALFEKTKYVLMSSGPVRLSFDVRPFYKHALVFSLFISLIGPFGGFFASGFKRAFQIKDFGNSIPGHGGFTDRFDCQYIVSAFLFVYLPVFVRSVEPRRLFTQFLLLDEVGQTAFVSRLSEHLVLPA